MSKALNIRLHKAAKHNHKEFVVERFHRLLSHSITITSDEQQTPKYFVEATMLSAYAWNAIPVDETNIARSIPAIGRPLKFPMDIVLTFLP